MEDKELLELAAKAAGHRLAPHGRTDGAFMVLMNDDGDFIWNPLTNDGDALRLAVTVGISDLSLAVGALFLAEGFPADRMAGIRCAIVRAAAEIGLARQPASE